ncbi:MAG: SufE family protein [Candidatus Woesearchaeota archaeon]
MSLTEIQEDLQTLSARERFIYLIELGEELPEYPEEYKTKKFEVQGCQSHAYIRATTNNNKIQLQGFANAKVVRGYIYILLQALNNKSAQEILASKQQINSFIQQTGLNTTTQTSRADAFSNLYNHIQQEVRKLS